MGRQSRGKLPAPIRGRETRLDREADRFYRRAALVLPGGRLPGRNAKTGGGPRIRLRHPMPALRGHLGPRLLLRRPAGRGIELRSDRGSVRRGRSRKQQQQRGGASQGPHFCSLGPERRRKHQRLRQGKIPAGGPLQPRIRRGRVRPDHGVVRGRLVLPQPARGKGGHDRGLFDSGSPVLPDGQPFQGGRPPRRRAGRSAGGSRSIPVRVVAGREPQGPRGSRFDMGGCHPFRGSQRAKHVG
mmetsp:Transcript_6916/g.14035  ORF Transcript_6916/g.14035 Transcript_6916/m.14035 type:complete len:242 (-) Transcript_6916:1052-1777(-)